MVDVLIAIAHLGGPIAVDILLAVPLLFLSMKVSTGHKNRLEESVSLELRVPINQLAEVGWTDEIRSFYSKRYSNELMVNRLSDFCGVISTFWTWAILAIQILIWGATAWFTFSDDLNIAVFAWFIIAVQIASWMIAELFSFACRLLTGRNPGEAKAMRKEIANSLV